MSMMGNVHAFQPRGRLMRRPRLLVEAARAGQSGWKRDRHLARALKSDQPLSEASVLARLYAEEQRLEDERRESAASYDLQRHVLLLIAILAETRAAMPQPVPAVAGSFFSAPGTASPAHP
ncbi:DUF6477 family protein [Paracoccus sulfuroxidans]|uniref:Uncharacterized protein n=1 Tax=Paracoccus sulfuroxidans TaxID=384678 RepID=A0A562P0H2_9RHOB|nr:DUF6477 family protein [Paracoccus sulfuroxidans]TWI37944.1 hypothetical protein IQ24_00075 [Paracoccus sulfuroxidans]